jgi:hypothetical protein
MKITCQCWLLVEDVRRDPVQVVVDGFGHHREAGLARRRAGAGLPLLQDHSAPSNTRM